MKDLARIYIKAGDGGDGSVHFLHGKYQPKGGPDGGDGGDGGDIILMADENIANLVEFNYKKKYIVPNADHGWGKNMHGKDTDDLEVRVPVGTVVYEISQDFADVNLRERATFDKMMSERRMIVDMVKHGQRFEAAWGGRGGRGNFQFRSSTNQTPKEFEPGKPGDEKWLLLEMKVVASIGIVGLPNVGKSSLLKALTNANPKIAGYPFTTLEPNLGELDGRIIADIPGLIEGASTGKGLGTKFLKHVEKVKLLLHCISSESIDLERDYQVVIDEMKKYNPVLLKKKQIILLTKTDLITSSEVKKKIKILEKIGMKVIALSIHDDKSLENLAEYLD